MKILMIGAHQDDNEFRCGGLASKYAKLGHEVVFLSVCNGCGGHHILTKEEIVSTRAKESQKVAEFLGITYDVWDIDDCSVMADLETRRRMIRYIRKINPDVIISHRTNDYMADHRIVGQLVQDASYMLLVPHECPDVEAMKSMPFIFCNEDSFKNPPFSADVVIDMDDEIDTKLKIADTNKSQVYEWLPYTFGTIDTVPEGDEERYEWLKGMNITKETTDEEILSLSVDKGYAIRYAMPAAKYRKELIERYGEKRGKEIRYAEVYEICEYGKQPTKEDLENIFPF